MSWWVLLLWGLSQGQRTPIPESAVQKEKEKLVREVFKSDYAKKSPSDRVALAKKLLQQGLETRDDLGAQYVMLREAADLSSSTGDVATAVDAIGNLAKIFEVDGLRLKLGVLTGTAQETKSPEAARAAADALLKLVEEALAGVELETAEKAAAAAVTAARKAKDVPLAARAEVKQREAGEAKSRQARVKTARETLQVDPEDPAANLEMGQYECFTKGNWEAGLLLLAKGSNEPLKLLALRDLSRPEDLQEQIGLGDAWKERAEKESANRDRIRGRAIHWYEQALPRASGLMKLKVEKAIAALGGSGSSAARARNAPDGIVGWWKLDEGTGTIAEDSSGYKLHGKLGGTTEWIAGQFGKAVRLGGADGQIVVADAPSLRLTGDLTIALWFRKDDQQSDWARLVGKGDHRLRNYGIFAGGKQQQGIILFQQWEGEKKEIIALQGKSKIETGKWHHVAVTVRGEDVVLYVAGQVDAVGRRNGGTPATSPDPVTFGFANFHQPFPGALDDIRIYQRALSEQEIRTLAGVK